MIKENIVEKYQKALKFGMDNVNLNQYMKYAEEDDTISLSDAGKSVSAFSTAGYISNKYSKLPCIIGTKLFCDDDFIGYYYKLF